MLSEVYVSSVWKLSCRLSEILSVFFIDVDPEASVSPPLLDPRFSSFELFVAESGTDDRVVSRCQDASLRVAAALIYSTLHPDQTSEFRGLSQKRVTKQSSASGVGGVYKLPSEFGGEEGLLNAVPSEFGGEGIVATNEGPYDFAYQRFR